MLLGAAPSLPAAGPHIPLGEDAGREDVWAVGGCQGVGVALTACAQCQGHRMHLGVNILHCCALVPIVEDNQEPQLHSPGLFCVEPKQRAWSVGKMDATA